MQEAAQKAAVLLEAVKYIKQFENKIVVIKYGGNAMESESLKASVFEDMSVLAQLGLRLVIVHGGGPNIDAELQKHGIEKQFIDGLRVTDDATLKIVAETLAAVNQDCLKGLANVGMRAQDYALGSLRTEKLDERLGHVGKVVEVNTEPLLAALADGVVPVVSSLGQDADGQIHNVNADTAATKLAEALRAEKLTILTNVDGVLDDHGRRVSHISIDEIDGYVARGVIHGGMIPKVEACAHAVRHGVQKAHLLNGTIPRALLLEIYTDAGVGTEIVA